MSEKIDQEARKAAIFERVREKLPDATRKEFDNALATVLDLIDCGMCRSYEGTYIEGMGPIIDVVFDALDEQDDAEKANFDTISATETTMDLLLSEVRDKNLARLISIKTAEDSALIGEEEQEEDGDAAPDEDGADTETGE